VLNDEAVEFLRGLEGSRGVLGGVDVDAGVAGNLYAGSVVGMNGRSWEVLMGEGEVIAGMLAVFPAIRFSFVARPLLLVAIQLDRRYAVLRTNERLRFHSNGVMLKTSCVLAIIALARATGRPQLQEVAELLQLHLRNSLCKVRQVIHLEADQIIHHKSNKTCVYLSQSHAPQLHASDSTSLTVATDLVNFSLRSALR